MVSSRLALLDLGLHGHVTAGEKAKPNLLLLTIAERGKPVSPPEHSGRQTVRNVMEMRVRNDGKSKCLSVIGMDKGKFPARK